MQKDCYETPDAYLIESGHQQYLIKQEMDKGRLRRRRVVIQQSEEHYRALKRNLQPVCYISPC